MLMYKIIEQNIMAWRWRPKKIRNIKNLTKLEKEEIYTEWEFRGWKEMTMIDFAHNMRIAPYDLKILLKTFEKATGQDVQNELTEILRTDTEIVRRSQIIIRKFLEEVEGRKTKLNNKDIETLIKASDASLKRSAVIQKGIDERKAWKSWTENVSVKVTL